MIRQNLFILILFTALTGCGQQSEIKHDVKSQRLAEAYGDGKYVIRDLAFPLDDDSLIVKNPLPTGFVPIAGGIIKFVGNIFAKNTDLGKMQMAYTQPIPEIPTEYLPSVRLKRLFFYMKPVGKSRLRDWWDRWIMGRGHVTFDFLDKLAVRMTSTTVQDPKNYISHFVTDNTDRNSESPLMNIFKKNYKGPLIDTEVAREVILVKYDSKKKAEDNRRDDYGSIHILETTGQPTDVKYFLADQPLLKGKLKRILILGQSILVELRKDLDNPFLPEEDFKSVLSESAQELENLGVTYIDTCTKNSCLELAVPDVNLVPIAMKGNSLKLDAIIQAGKVPESFQLKGFVEFEVKVNSPI